MPGERGDEGCRRTRAPARVLGGVLAEQRTPDRRAADVSKRLGREELPIRLDDRQSGSLVALVECETGEDLAAEIRRPDTVSREAEPVVDAASAAEDREVGRGDVDGAAPGALHL